MDALKHFDFLCMNYVMYALTDSLNNVYSEKKTTKELWESLHRKYKTEDVEGITQLQNGRHKDRGQSSLRTSSNPP